ncbi:hypothetical protein [Butyrivibrio sp. XBB1001]|jgi:hypothetical protein|uniref:hypothetical protein n=1 Tax=Butyrivibrio sp. XBB1001 TaxID=1280682 RepID=UPI000409E6E9|nr:hypothetical protein [Butyrivibrio sp. XBB1001]
MKTWTSPEIKELNISNTALGNARSGYCDAAVYSIELHRNFYSFSGEGEKNQDDWHVTPQNP